MNVRLAISLELQPGSGHLLAARLMVVCSLYLMKNLFSSQHFFRQRFDEVGSRKY